MFPQQWWRCPDFGQCHDVGTWNAWSASTATCRRWSTLSSGFERISQTFPIFLRSITSGLTLVMLALRRFYLTTHHDHLESRYWPLTTSMPTFSMIWSAEDPSQEFYTSSTRHRSIGSRSYSQQSRQLPMDRSLWQQEPVRSRSLTFGIPYDTLVFRLTLFPWWWETTSLWWTLPRFPTPSSISVTTLSRIIEHEKQLHRECFDLNSFGQSRTQRIS